MRPAAGTLREYFGGWFGKSPGFVECLAGDLGIAVVSRSRAWVGSSIRLPPFWAFLRGPVTYCGYRRRRELGAPLVDPRAKIDQGWPYQRRV